MDRYLHPKLVEEIVLLKTRVTAAAAADPTE
jgi:hypothetical protein